ncbi:DgyrCDS4812 [Dimorphilus gyrociliatus]|uniref:Delta-like protein n=1 Tax=Dimorphilus gyrociliatus TaxID=2664684 RepID=A0A7I8VHP5_9ANNE|nr:DgyrCDS4812 [Dimorphilus gyrociliatus]
MRGLKCLCILIISIKAIECDWKFYVQPLNLSSGPCDRFVKVETNNIIEYYVKEEKLLSFRTIINSSEVRNNTYLTNVTFNYLNSSKSQIYDLRSFVNVKEKSKGVENLIDKANNSSLKLGLEYVINCAENYFGPQCSNYCFPKDDDFYKCNYTTGEKICHKGWKGEYCQEKSYYCSDSMPCDNGGRCTIIKNQTKCICPKDFSGTHCQYVLLPTEEDYSGEERLTSPEYTTKKVIRRDDNIEDSVAITVISCMIIALVLVGVIFFFFLTRYTKKHKAKSEKKHKKRGEKGSKKESKRKSPTKKAAESKNSSKHTFKKGSSKHSHIVKEDTTAPVKDISIAVDKTEKSARKSIALEDAKKIDKKDYIV